MFSKTSRVDSPCGSTMTCLCARCTRRPFSFLPNRRPMEDLMPFFFGCLCRESWLLATLLRALASASREDTILKTQHTQMTWVKKVSEASHFLCSALISCAVFLVFLNFLTVIYFCPFLSFLLSNIFTKTSALSLIKYPDYLQCWK